MLGPARLSVLIALLLSLAISSPAPSAQPACPPSATVPSPAALQEATRNAQDRGALWRFQKDGRHGYLVCEVTSKEFKATWRTVPTIRRKTTSKGPSRTFTVKRGSPKISG